MSSINMIEFSTAIGGWRDDDGLLPYLFYLSYLFGLISTPTWTSYILFSLHVIIVCIELDFDDV